MQESKVSTAIGEVTNHFLILCFILNGPLALTFEICLCPQIGITGP